LANADKRIKKGKSLINEIGIMLNLKSTFLDHAFKLLTRIERKEGMCKKTIRAKAAVTIFITSKL
jgi:hypothetical protein